METASYDIKDILVSGGFGIFGASTGWGIHISQIPAEVKQSIVIVEANKRLLQTIDRTSEVELGTIHLRAVSTDYPSAEKKINAIFNYLKNLYNYSINSTLYLDFNSFYGPFYDGKDEEHRVSLTIEFDYVRVGT